MYGETPVSRSSQPLTEALSWTSWSVIDMDARAKPATESPHHNHPSPAPARPPITSRMHTSLCRHMGVVRMDTARTHTYVHTRIHTCCVHSCADIGASVCNLPFQNLLCPAGLPGAMSRPGEGPTSVGGHPSSAGTAGILHPHAPWPGCMDGRASVKPREVNGNACSRWLEQATIPTGILVSACWDRYGAPTGAMYPEWKG